MPVTCTGVVDGAKLPVPSCPHELSPDVQIVPSLFRTTLLWAPAAACPVMLNTAVATIPLVVPENAATFRVVGCAISTAPLEGTAASPAVGAVPLSVYRNGKPGSGGVMKTCCCVKNVPPGELSAGAGNCVTCWAKVVWKKNARTMGRTIQDKKVRDSAKTLIRHTGCRSRNPETGARRGDPFHPGTVKIARRRPRGCALPPLWGFALIAPGPQASRLLRRTAAVPSARKSTSRKRQAGRLRS